MSSARPSGSATPIGRRFVARSPVVFVLLARLEGRVGKRVFVPGGGGRRSHRKEEELKGGLAKGLRWSGPCERAAPRSGANVFRRECSPLISPAECSTRCRDHWGPRNNQLLFRLGGGFTLERPTTIGGAPPPKPKSDMMFCFLFQTQCVS